MAHHLLLLIFSLLPALLPALPNPDPLQSFIPNPTPPNPTPSSPTQPGPTIPSFPEAQQSLIPGCPLLRLPAALFPAVKSSCSGSSTHISRSQCCPVLATWLFSAYSETALRDDKGTPLITTTSYEMPMLPDDSETCGTGLEKEMRARGVVLGKVNETCDVVSCFCGIRLHPLSCPGVFRVSEEGRFVGDARVSRLERDCGGSVRIGNATMNAKKTKKKKNVLARCSKCLHSLYSLKSVASSGSGNATKLEARTSKMRRRDCQLMGLTWLLNKDRDLYMSTVTAVMRALMLNSEDADPPSCSLSSNGMPLAVDSAEINDQSSSVGLKFSFYLLLMLTSLYLLLY